MDEMKKMNIEGIAIAFWGDWNRWGKEKV